MYETRIPTLLGIALLAVGSFCTSLLFRTQQISQSFAATKLYPKDIRVSNITDSSFTVSWITQEKTFAYISIWSKTSSRKKFTDGNNTKKFSHWINVDNLSENTTYYFTINIEGYEFDNEGIPWKATTGPKLPKPPPAQVISGVVLTSDAKQLEGILVYAQVLGGNTLSTKTASDGSFFIPISSARVQTLDSYILQDGNKKLVEIFVQGGIFGISSAKTYSDLLILPPLVLGKPEHDFRMFKTIQSSEIPKAEIDLPKENT